MSRTLISRTVVPFAEPKEETFGLSVTKEVWSGTTGGETTYWKYQLPHSVQVLPVTPEGKIICISEFQPGVGTEYLHCIGETMEPGEDMLTAAHRGLYEETGYRSSCMTLLSSVLENTVRSDRLVHMFLARDCVRFHEGGEGGISVVLLTPQEFWGRLMRYFLAHPRERHGAGNTLKVAALAFHTLGFLSLKGGV